MSDTTKFAKYAEIMKKCRKVYNIVPIVYIVFGVFYFLVSFMFLIVTNLGAYFVFIDSLIFLPFVCYLGFRGAYCRHDLAALAVPVISFLNLAILGYGAKHLAGKSYGIAAMNVPRFSLYIWLIFFMASSFIAYINIKANNNFRFLEKQVGFPLFNERAEEQRVDKIRREIKDPFQVEYDKRMRTASTKMDSIAPSEPDIFK